MNAQDRKRFWDKVRKTEGCWIWEGSYREERPIFCYMDRQEYAHRCAFEFNNPPIQKGERIRHTCKNIKCVHPEHLERSPPSKCSTPNGQRIDEEDILQRRFWSKVKKAPGGCWLWTGTINGEGYGGFRVEGTMVKAHRLAYTLMVGPIPKDKCVLHHCDTPGCVNPAHLFIGTKKDNTADAQRKGRWHTAKLTQEQVRKIRRLYVRGKTQTEIAALFQLTQGTVSVLVNQKTWKFVK